MSSKENPILWTPSEELLTKSQMARFKAEVEKNFERSFPDYETLYEWSVGQPASFWKSYLDFSDLLYSGSTSPILKSHQTFFKNEFFPNLHLSYAENLMMRMPREGAVLVALTEDSCIRRSWTREEIFQAVSLLQGKLRAAGVQKGDRVAAILPNAPESVLAMLATTGLGAIWSSCSPDFGEQAIHDRFAQIEPKFIFFADEVIYSGKRFVLADKNKNVLSRLPTATGTHTFSHLSSSNQEALAIKSHTALDPHFEHVPFRHPLFVMFSSGTTGAPKCIVHGVGGTLLQHQKELQLHCDLMPGEKILYYTTCGWMMWNWVTSALSVGARVYCYDGSPAAPSADSLWEIVDREQIHVFGTSAKFLGSCRNQNLGITNKFALSQLRLVLSTGSPLLPEDFDYFYSSRLDAQSRLQLASICGGTDIISCFMLGNPLKPVRRGEIQGRGLGMNVQAFNSGGAPVTGEQGELVCLAPFPSMPLGFWNDVEDRAYTKSYFSVFKNTWHHGDFITITPKGGVIVHGRSDATLNPSGVRIGTAEIYRQVETHPLIADSLAVGRRTQDDEEIVLFVKFKNPSTILTEDIIQDLKSRIRQGASPRHVPAAIYSVEDIPYTVSGKKVEIAVKKILHGQNPGNKEALSNPQSLDLFEKFPKGLS
jgi:acetoacetyl-CoA synthetase